MMKTKDDFLAAKRKLVGNLAQTQSMIGQMQAAVTGLLTRIGWSPEQWQAALKLIPKDAEILDIKPNAVLYTDGQPMPDDWISYGVLEKREVLATIPKLKRFTKGQRRKH